jgi:hypothetical protein
MKKLLHIVVVNLMMLLAARPSLSAILCAAPAISNAACGMSCPMAMSGMGADCRMRHELTSGPCLHACCQQAPALLPIQPSAHTKFSPLNIPLVPATQAAPQIQRLGSLLWPPGQSSGPERHILLQVFRI